MQCRQRIPDYQTGIELFLRYLCAEDTGVIGDVTEISAADSAVRVLVIPTDEELGIARRTYEYQ